MCQFFLSLTVVAIFFLSNTLLRPPNPDNSWHLYTCLWWKHWWKCTTLSWKRASPTPQAVAANAISSWNMLSLPVWIKVKEYKKNPKGITCCDFRFSCFISSVRVCACVCVFVENLPGSSGSSKLPLVCFLKEAKGSGGYQPRGILGGLAVWQVCALASEELPWRWLVDSQWCALFCHAFCTCWSFRVKPDCESMHPSPSTSWFHLNCVTVTESEGAREHRKWTNKWERCSEIPL